MNNISTIAVIAKILNKNNINYIFGGSCSLLIHGLDVVPNDIDLVVKNSDLNKANLCLKGYEYEIHTFPIKKSEVTTVVICGVPVRVNKLEAEYEYYIKRKGESEKVDTKIEMIKQKLDKSTGDS